jgi:hypothetical protein
MTDDPTPLVPRDTIDVGRPTPARMYDWYLGGENNFTVDKQFGEREVELCPWIPQLARDNRDFLRRAVRYMLGEGITQFLDIGSGVPTVGNVHQVAHEINPEARIVYVDKDMEAVTSSQVLLRDEPNATVIHADLRDPASILDHPDLALLDFARPVGLLTVSVWPFVPDADDPAALMATYLDRLVSGSYLAISHVTLDNVPEHHRRQLAQAAGNYDTEASDPVAIRTRAQFEALINGVTLVHPGISYTSEWRPDKRVDTESPARPCNYAAVGKKA